jgi:SpoVK/Ycf46/Vps4 family AAA+-type ATPase
MSDNNDNKKRKIDQTSQTNNNTDKNKFIKLINITKNLIDDSSESSEEDYSSEDEFENKDLWPYKEINKEITSLDDLIELGKMYDPEIKVRYNIDLEKLSNLVKPLEKLMLMIGLNNIKESIVGHITYYLANLEEETDDMMHTVITGPPGVGKTQLGKILGDIYYNLGILKGNNSRKRDRYSKNVNHGYIFKIIKRSDLIGKYLGHTAVKTQKVIDSCEGGVLFIDEAYSLGNPEGRDSFSKECIDTINQNLTEKKSNFLCIIAGYKDALEKCFFSYNEGLSRRFTFRYNIEKYTAEELKLIFHEMVKKLGWTINEKDIKNKFFEENYSNFKNMAGDMETLLFNCKIAHGKRVFCKPKEKKILTLEDIKNGFKRFNEGRGNDKEDVREQIWKNMYI